MPQQQKPVVQQFPPNFHNTAAPPNRIGATTGTYNIAKKETGKMQYQVPSNMYTGNPNPQAMGNMPPNQVTNPVPVNPSSNPNPNPVPQNIVQNQLPRTGSNKGEEKPATKQGKKK